MLAFNTAILWHHQLCAFLVMSCYLNYHFQEKEYHLKSEVKKLTIKLQRANSLEKSLRDAIDALNDKVKMLKEREK